jgi:hypothetical protein
MTSETTGSRRLIYLKAALFVILMLVAGFFLVIFFIAGIIGALVTGDYTLFIGGVFFFILFILVGSIAKKLEPAWKEFEDVRGIKPKSTREALKDSLPFLAILILTMVLGFLLESYFLSFPPTISPDLAQEMLKSILTIDGILIGFCGVVLAQFLWAIHSKGNVIYEQMITHKGDEATIQNLNGELERLGRTRLTVIASVFYSMMPLLASILLCLSNLTLIEGNEPISTKTLMFNPILTLMVGIMLLAIVTLQTSLLPRSSTCQLT